MTFPADRWPEVEALFERALQEDIAARQAFLDAACGGDAALRAEVASLLAADAGADEGLRAVVRSIEDAAAETSGPGEEVGRFRLLREIGRGGMGVVYLAERADGAFEQRVAVKLLPAGAPSSAARRRFSVERQVLAHLDHPAIARLLDGGTTADGRPYLVMEYVEGERIDRWCEGRPLEDRLRLFLAVCEAVESAHRKSVVHRDLKPSNILVSPEGHPKLLDFGIAKLLGTNALAGELAVTLTLPAAQALTPEFASPEQVLGAPITAASDVYSLGLLLYQLLTGVAAQPWNASGGESLETAVCRREPESPSTAMRRAVEPATRGHGPQLAVVAEQLKGDLDRIVLKAIRKEPAARYASVAALAEDLERWLAGRPAKARRGAWSYRLRRSWRRHPAAVAALGAALAVALLFVALLFFVVRSDKPGVGKHEEAAAFAGREAGAGPAAAIRRAAAVLDFQNLSGDAESAWLSGGLAELLRGEIGAGEALRVVPGDEVVRGARGFEHAGISPSSEDVTHLAGRLGADVVVAGTFLRPAGGGTLRVDCRVLTASGTPLALLHESGSAAEVLDIVSRLGARLRETLGVTPLSPAELAALGASRPGNPQAARRYVSGLEALRRFDARHARDLLVEATAADPKFALSHARLAEAWRELGYDARALAASREAFERAAELPRAERLAVEAVFREASQQWQEAISVQKSRAALFPDDPEIGLDLARVETRAGQADAALATVGELMSRLPEAAADPRFELARAEALGSRSDFAGQLTAARAAARSAGERTDPLIVARARLAEWWALRNLGKLDQATAAAAEAGQLFTEAGDRGGAGRAKNAQATTLADQGRVDEAARLDREALAIFRETEDRRRIGWSLNNLARHLLGRGDRQGARRMLEETLAIGQEVGDASAVARAQAHLGRMSLEDGDLAAAEALHRQSLEGRQAIGEARGIAGARLDLALVRLARGELSAAVPEIAAAATAFLDLGDKQSAAHAYGFLGDARLATGELEEARRAFERSLALRETLGSSAVALSRLGLAEVALAQGSPAAAAGTLEELLAPERRDVLAAQMPRAWALLALSRRQRGDREGAEEGRRQAVEALRSRSTSLAGRLEVEILLARAGGEVDLDRVLGEAHRAGLPELELEARLARLERQAPASQRAEAESLAAAARATGYGEMARRAERLASEEAGTR